jgi:magnesium-protoporphyrin O-methyltransferase
MRDTQSAEKLRSYFEGPGFDSLSLVYGDEACDGFRSAIRKGHREVIETVISWLGSSQALEQCSVLDAGCGTGALAVPLALAGARVDAIDFSANMVAAAEERARQAQAPAGRLKFAVGDLAGVRETYDAVVCIDVFARYPTEATLGTLKQLASLTRSRLIFTFTPKQFMDPILLAIGGVVAKRRQAPPLYTHSKEAIVRSLTALGWEVYHRKQFSAGWKSYFCCLVDARRQSALI